MAAAANPAKVIFLMASPLGRRQAGRGSEKLVGLGSFVSMNVSQEGP